MRRIAIIGLPDKEIVEVLNKHGFNVYSTNQRILEVAQALNPDLNQEVFFTINNFIRTFDELAPLNYLLERIPLSKDIAITDITTMNELIKLKSLNFTIINPHPDKYVLPADVIGFTEEVLFEELLPKKWVEDFEKKSKVSLNTKGFFVFKLKEGFFLYSINQGKFYVEALYSLPKKFEVVKTAVINLAKSLGFNKVYWITYRNSEAFAKLSKGKVVANILEYEVS